MKIKETKKKNNKKQQNKTWSLNTYEILRSPSIYRIWKCLNVLLVSKLWIGENQKYVAITIVI